MATSCPSMIFIKSRNTGREPLADSARLLEWSDTLLLPDPLLPFHHDPSQHPVHPRLGNLEVIWGQGNLGNLGDRRNVPYFFRADLCRILRRVSQALHGRARKLVRNRNSVR